MHPILEAFATRLQAQTKRRILPSIDLPHSVLKPGLAREDMGDLAFEETVPTLRSWCESYCSGYFDITGVHEGHRLTGRLFEFSDPHDAVHFALRWR